MKNKDKVKKIVQKNSSNSRQSIKYQAQKCSRHVDSVVRPSGMKPIGILGGGQLAQMLILKAHEIGLPVCVLSQNDDDPATLVAPNWTKGNPNLKKDLLPFLKKCSVVTVESEFLDCAILQAAENETGTAVFPRPHILGHIQDRLTQKQLLTDHGLATAKYCKVDSPHELWGAYMTLGEGALVLKKRRFGYDGNGTFILRSKQDIEKFLANERASNFNQNGFIAEKLVSFRRELAVMAARSANGSCQLLPFVETKQENSRCLWVKGPISATPRFKSMSKKIKNLLAAIDYVGVMGIELFDLGDQLLVNELAPRVHNSGHYSMDCLTTDQFELHLMAILGKQLEPPKPSHLSGFAMMNLIGSADTLPSWKPPKEAKVHWYGKQKNRSGRKMGHINSFASSPEKALAILKRERRKFEV